jgi:hypothetical protein
MIENLLSYDFDLQPKPQLATAYSVSPILAALHV